MHFERQAFFLLLGIVTVAFLALLQPLLGAIVWAVALAILFHGVNARLVRRLRRPTLGTALTVAIVCLLVLLPLSVVGTLLVGDILALVGRIQSGELDLSAMFARGLDILPAWLRAQLEGSGLGTTAALQARLEGLAGLAAQRFAPQALNAGQATLAFLVSLGVMLYLLFFFLRDGAELSQTIRHGSPLSRPQSHRLLNKFTTVMRATVKGNVVVAGIQGALGGIAFAVLGVEGALLWGVLMALFSLVPAVGGAIVWIPVVLILLATGAVWKAVVLAVFCAVFVGLVDNVLRPLLVGKETRMPDWVVLVSTLGGITMFGVNGFVIGPVIAALFMTFWTLLSELREEMPEREAPVAPPLATP